jgi:hypothetical protein
MAASAKQLYNSEELNGGDSPALLLKYLVEDTADRDVALTTLKAAVPSSVTVDGKTCRATSYELTPVGDPTLSLKWKADISYDNTEQSGGGAESDPAEESFDISAQNKHIKTAIQGTTVKYPASDSTPDVFDMIGINTDGTVQGTDILEPIYTYSLSKYWDDSSITTAFKAQLLDLVGKVNEFAFDGFAIKEVRLDGVSGNKISNDQWQLSYRFSVKKSATTPIQVNDGGVLNVETQGWQYAWVYYVTGKITRELIPGNVDIITQVPEFVYVQDVYKTGNFDLLDLGVPGS